MSCVSLGRVFTRFLLGLGFSLSNLGAQTVTQFSVAGISTSLDAILVATGDGAVPVIAGTTVAHRDALLVTGGGTLALLSGANVAVKNDNNLTAFLRVGYGDAQTGTLTIASGANLAVGQASRYANFHVGEGQGATGTVRQSGGTFLLKGSFNVGVNGGTGLYDLSGGTLTLDHDDAAVNHTTLAVIGFNNFGAGSGASTGTLNLSGGTLNVTAHEWDPAGHPGQYGSVSLILGNRATGAANYGAGDGTLTQTGGLLHVDNAANLFLSSVGSGTYNLNGGTLEIGGNSLKTRYGSGPGTATFNLGGGTIRVTGSNLNTAVDANLTAGQQSVLDTNGFNAAWNGNFSGTGALVKSGAGVLTLSGTSRTFGFFNAAQGTTVQTAGTTTSPEFTVGSGTGANGTFTLSGGTIVIDNVPPFGGSSSGLRVGDFGGTGVFNQTGGTITIGSASAAVGGSLNVGNQGGTGTYNLSGGTLILARGTHNLGRNVTGATPSTGTFNLSGGLLEVIDGTSFILGDRDGGGLTGTGVLTQTGGTLRITHGNLYLSSFGAGIYNLNGGTLEAGGATSLRANFVSSAGGYTFNLGGGTIKVIGSALSVSARATFAAGTTSTIDTNGFAATWSGNLDGAGGLTKTGAGILTLSGTNTYAGATNVNQGTLKLGSAGALSPNTTLSVADGASFDANGFAQTLSNLGGTGTINVGQAGLAVTPTGENVFTGTIAGTGGLTMNGTGTLVLGNANNFTGATTVSQGTIRLGTEGALPTGTAVSLGAAATLDLNGHAATLSQLTGAGEIALGTASLTISQSTSTTFTGEISGTGGLVKSGTGVLTLGGANDFTGATTVSQGTIRLGTAGALPTGTAVTLGASATLDLNGHAATLGQLTGAGEVTLGAASLTISQNASTTFSGGISGTGGLVKEGNGLLTLSGTNNFTGTTSVGGGELKITGSATHSDFTVAGGTLSGTGTIANLTLAAGGTLAPGNSPGTLNAGNTTWAGGGTFEWEINNATGTAGTNWDLLAISGGLTITASQANPFTVSLISLLANNSAGDVPNFDAGINHTYLIASTTGGITGFDTTDFILDVSGFTNDYTGSWSLAVDGTNLHLNYAATAIPEPATCVLVVGAAMLALALTRRRRSF